MSDCLYAFTDAEYATYPAFVNVSKEGEDIFRLIVRSPEAADASEIVLSRDQLRALLIAIDPYVQ